MSPVQRARGELEEQTEKNQHRPQGLKPLCPKLYVSLSVTAACLSAHLKAKTGCRQTPFMHLKFTESYSQKSVDKAGSINI